MPPKSLRELRTWSGWRREREGGGEEAHTISHNTHTACGGGSGGRGNQFHCLPLSKCISIYNPWNSVCAGQCIRNRWINKQRIPCWVFSKCAAFSFVFQLFLLLLLLLPRWFIFIFVALCEFRRHRATAKSFGGTRVSVWTRQVEGDPSGVLYIPIPFGFIIIELSTTCISLYYSIIIANICLIKRVSSIYFAFNLCRTLIR